MKTVDEINDEEEEEKAEKKIGRGSRCEGGIKPWRISKEEGGEQKREREISRNELFYVFYVFYDDRLS